MLSTPKRSKGGLHPVARVLLTIVLVVVCSDQFQVSAQCFGGVETYEKTSGTSVLCPGNECNTRGLLSQPDTSITRDCIAMCKQSSGCNSFTVNYLIGRCQSYDIDTNTIKGKQRLLRDSVVNYFEKVCLKGVRQSQFDKICNPERGWAFERAVGASVDGFDNKKVDGVESHGECGRLCLLEEDFECRSAEFSLEDKTCTLSREDRYTQPEAFRTNTPEVDYIENQCAKTLPDCSYTAAKEDTTVRAMDDILFSRTSMDCQRFCDDAKAFNCRSYAQKDDRCFLSGDDTSTMMQDTPQPTDIGAIYKEKVCTRSTCDGGLFTFEKTTGHFLRTAQQELLKVELTSPAITIPCATKCLEQGSDCPAFILDYSDQRCYRLDRNTQGRGDTLAIREGINYFEKTCLRGNIRDCRDKAWAFERTPGMHLKGHEQRVIATVPNRRDCEELCLMETVFKCLSASYNSVSLECSLSSETRRTKPESFQKSNNLEYLENQCVKSAQNNCPYQRMENAHPRYLDVIINHIKNEIACEVTCTFHEHFTCRAFAYFPSAGQCFLSGDDKVSAGPGALQSRAGTDYLERNCNSNFATIDLAQPNFDSLNAVMLPNSGSSSPRPTFSQEKRCHSGKLAYEKATGYELIRANPVRLYGSMEGGIVAECGRRCKEDTGCLGFNMDYNRNECQKVHKNSDNNLFNLRPSGGVSYFEAICLKTVPSCRNKKALWHFERFIDMELAGLAELTLSSLTKTECEDKCLSQTAFQCRSASYDHLRAECHLSRFDRFSKPDAFTIKQGTDYLENQCQSRQIKCPFTTPTEDQYSIYTDKVVDLMDEQSCKQACILEEEFNCRSYSFLKENRTSRPRCLLSGDTQKSAGRNAFQISQGAIYSERDCKGEIGVNQEAVLADTTMNSYGGNMLIDESSLTRMANKGLDSFNLEGDSFPAGKGQTDRNQLGGNPENCRAVGLVPTFEKVMDFTFDMGDKEQVLASKDIGVIIECLDFCKDQGPLCLSATLLNERGGRQRCFAHQASALTTGSSPTAAIGTSYFEKICIREQSCRKKWSFTRVPRFEFIGDANEEVNNVSNVAECRNLCLAATFYNCRSATYDSNAKICRLTEETKRSAPSEFRPADFGIDYFENECSEIPSNCEYLDHPGTYLPYTDTYLSKVNDIEECRTQCTSQAKYNCRSFNYNAFRKECFLSSDDSVSLPSGLQQDRDFTFSERGACNSGTTDQYGGIKVKVECTPSDMLIHLNLGREFKGRVYATGNPQACFELGGGATELTLKIPLGTQCGTVQQNRGRYVNHVVIQENPVIMQDSDKTVRVECAFTAEDQTVTFSPTGGINSRLDGGAGGISITVPFQPTGTNIVTNTAPTPGVLMRVIRRNGETATMVGLGEDLQLRIEIDQDSAFGLFARKLEARTDNGELMNLIDDFGCPINELIFPPLDLEKGTKALFADFKAFRFPSTPIVNFVATVQFCQDVCDPTECSGGLRSVGRKRRALQRTTAPSSNSTTKNSTSEEGLYYRNWDPLRVGPLYQEQIKDNTWAANTDKKRLARDTGPPELYRGIEESGANSTRLLPEHIDLGLRITVGEDVLHKPFLQSHQGDGKFPELARNSKDVGTREKSGDSTPHFPASPPGGVVEVGTNKDYVCSSQTTIAASVVIVIVLLLCLTAAFGVFYRYKRRQWLKKYSYRTPQFSSVQTTASGKGFRRGSSFLSTFSAGGFGGQLSKLTGGHRLQRRMSRVHPEEAIAGQTTSGGTPPPLPARPATASGILQGFHSAVAPVEEVSSPKPQNLARIRSSSNSDHGRVFYINPQGVLRQRINGPPESIIATTATFSNEDDNPDGLFKSKI